MAFSKCNGCSSHCSKVKQLDEMRLVDAHCHLESNEFAGKVPTILGQARSVGVVCLITNSWTPEVWDVSESLGRHHAEVEFCLGIHPWYARPEHLTLCDTLNKARERGAVGIGEIGLDRKCETPWDLQMEIFQRQLEVAYELELPVNMHCRAAYQDLLEILRRKGVLPAGGIIHSFAGSVEIAQELAKYRVSFAMGGILTRRNSSKREKALRWMFPEHFLLETDAPDIPPIQWLRKGPNVPANIILNLEAAADMLDLTPEEVAWKTTQNADRIFRLGLGES